MKCDNCKGVGWHYSVFNLMPAMCMNCEGVGKLDDFRYRLACLTDAAYNVDIEASLDEERLDMGQSTHHVDLIMYLADFIAAMEELEEELDVDAPDWDLLVQAAKDRMRKDYIEDFLSQGKG